MAMHNGIGGMSFQLQLFAKCALLMDFENSFMCNSNKWTKSELGSVQVIFVSIIQIIEETFNPNLTTDLHSLTRDVCNHVLGRLCCELSEKNEMWHKLMKDI